MIKHLILHNFVLVERCAITFDSSFNAVTGETGAGKTALIEAIALALGARADSGLIRKGCDRASIEISFDSDATPPHVKEMLSEAGLLNAEAEELIIRREISKEGKNRAFINCHMASLPFLQKIGSELIDLIGQHAHKTLRESQSQRALLDLFGGLQPALQEFQRAYAKEKEWQAQLETLEQLSSQRARNEDTYRMQLQEIESVALKKGEEEEGFERYQKLAHSTELAEKIDLAIKGLSDGAIPHICRCIKSIDPLLSYDKTLSDPSSLLHEAHIALSESLRALQSYAQSSDANPHALERLEERLSSIARLKRKYGQSFEEIQSFRLHLEKELSRLENSAEELQKTEAALKEAQVKTHAHAGALTAQRQAAALQLSHTLTAQLQQLNMNGAEVHIAVVPCARHSSGDDTIEFWLKANTGEHPGLVKEHSSGGELSRLLLAIKLALAEKNNTPTLIFDEIDANVGGETATVIGEKLQELGQCRQVICITHFPQVAAAANTHFSVQKSESDGRTLTQITHLTPPQRKEELMRMIGGVDGLVALTGKFTD